MYYTDSVKEPVYGLQKMEKMRDLYAEAIETVESRETKGAQYILDSEMTPDRLLATNELRSFQAKKLKESASYALKRAMAEKAAYKANEDFTGPLHERVKCLEEEIFRVENDIARYDALHAQNMDELRGKYEWKLKNLDKTFEGREFHFGPSSRLFLILYTELKTTTNAKKEHVAKLESYRKSLDTCHGHVRRLR